MSKTLSDVRQEAMTRYGTANNQYSDFEVGCKVKVVTPFQDFYFFNGETGRVVRNNGRYLGIIVKFDKPREFKNGLVQKEFNFDPKDLLYLGEVINVRVEK